MAGTSDPPGESHSPGGPERVETRLRLEATVRGQVQGVGFRYFVQALALDLGLTGWVANLPDGGVRCVAEGPRATLERLRRELAAGPPGARVDVIEDRWGPADGRWTRFSIRVGDHRGD